MHQAQPAAARKGLAQIFLFFPALLALGCGSPTDPMERPAAATPVRVVGRVDTLNMLGLGRSLPTDVRDRAGNRIPDLEASWRPLDPKVASASPEGQLLAHAVGDARFVMSAWGIHDTLRIHVRQVPARVEVDLSADTLALDAALPLRVTVRDSNDFVIPRAVVDTEVSDTSVIAVGGDGSLRALLPGAATLTLQSGPASATRQVVVVGVALILDGKRSRVTGPVSVTSRFTVTNSRMRLRWRPGLLEGASVEAETRVGEKWVPATSPGNGDWLYVSSSVQSLPTSIEFVTLDGDQIAFRMRFGGHRFQPQLFGFPAEYQEQEYPFSRTARLRKGEWGYFSWVELEGTPMPYPNVEHEIGFGGLFGPALIRTSRESFRTESLPHNKRFNLEGGIDAVEFLRTGDQVARVLVPLGRLALITPVFPGWGFGSVYVNSHAYESYGAYLYAAPLGEGVSARAVCRHAWTTAPVKVEPVSEAELAGCGPAS